ncbi:MAG: peptidoglycan bridge formation glycyltransferase FemA/FemB family protein [Xanthomonadaceae bacterium]|nr:peptidoglycan bridge formation glycyltransferase FemA/FemB family protein [Rhodospirillaceae bacterium]NIA17879.1 peptidoglycan bridge formation glycyltransferase FemA/FemB family protein [Xanthomonadaceae bacterium]
MNILYFKKNEKEKWNNFVAKNSQDGGLLQSWEWGDFQKALGKKIFRFGIKDKNDKILMLCLSIKDKIALKKYTVDIYRGPIIKFSLIDNRGIQFLNLLSILLAELKNIAQKENAIMARIDFGIITNEKFLDQIRILKNSGIRRSYRDIQPRSTLIINLQKDEEKILKEMKQKHRYNIRLAKKRGVKIKLVNGNNLLEDFNEFWKLLKHTSKRDKFAIHKKDYYWKMLIQSNLDIKLYLAIYKSKIIAGAMIGCLGNTCVYMHGASDNIYRNVMAPYLLQWAAIKDAKNNGFQFYDLGGVKSEKEKSNSQNLWEGITRFKIGFAPNEKITEFLGLWDIPISRFQYSIYKFIRKIIKFINNMI